MTISTRLKNLNSDSLALDELIELAMGARNLRAGYESFSAAEPEWLGDAIATLTRDIRTRTADSIALRLREIEQAEAALLTASEKRTRLAEEKARLLERLHGEPVAK